MHNKLYFYIITLFITITLSACSNFLNEKFNLGSVADST